jgi:alkaline phosphatase
MKFKKYLFLIIFIFSIGCSYEHNSKPKNIILMIGDGMGIAQITAGMYSSNKPLNFTRFKTIGLMTNHSLNNIVTDSAASATAIATGKKTYNRAISVNIEKKPLKTIMEYAKEKGYNIGIVVTSSITDATPAAFISHTEDRENHYEIALDILELEPDIILGGGLRYFKDRPDQRDLIEELRKKDYEIFYRWEELINKIPDKKVIGLFADTGMPPVIKTMSNPESKYFEYLKKTTDFNQVRSKEYLLQMTRSAIMYLESKKKPFILMIEGSQIDWGGHNMDSKYIIAEVLDFDKAIGEVLDFAERDQNTLIIVTADHETSGFAITEGKLENNQPISNFETKFIHSKHTSTMVPVFSYGPGSKEFTGIYDNTDIFHKIKKLWF